MFLALVKGSQAIQIPLTYYTVNLQSYPPILPPLRPIICIVHPSALPPSLHHSISIHKLLHTQPHSNPHFPSLVLSFLPAPSCSHSPFSPLFSVHPSCLNNAVATQLHCHCPCFNVNVVSLSQLLGHYHPSQLIIVIQIHGQTKHNTENKGTHVENKSAHGAEKHAAVYGALIK